MTDELRESPNIVLIQADELHKDTLSSYGNDAIHTPNIDRIVADGMKFENAYTTSPWCLPARASLATGLYPRNNGAFTNYADWDGRLDPELPNIYTMLSSVGYTTSHIGKLHYAPMPFARSDPEEVGAYGDHIKYFESLGMDHLIVQDDKHVSLWCYDDYSKAADEAGHLDSYRDRYYQKEYNKKVFLFPGPPEWHPDGWVGQQAADYIRNYSDENPLFTWVSFSGPHYPFDPPEEYLDKVNMDAMAKRIAQEGEFEDSTKIHYDSYHGKSEIRRIDGNAVTDAMKDHSEEFWIKLRRYYLANIALIDEQVGEILTAIEENLGSNTLLIFTADHGEMMGNHSLWGKHNSGYEDVINVPLGIKHLGGSVNETTDEKVMTTDITATCLSVGGVEGPTLDGSPLYGVNELPDREYVISEGGGFATVTDGKYKYIHLYQDGEEYSELYNLQKDPHEFENVEGDDEYALTQSRLQSVLTNRYIDGTIPFKPRPIDI